MKNSLKLHRQKQSLSQVDLAKALSVSRQTIHAIEVGKYDPSLPLAFKIAQFFEVTIEQLFQPDPA